mgnify:CR=1 FL=1
MKVKRYRAYYYPKGSTIRAGLIGVLAENEAAARQRVYEELQKPGRWPYFRLWQQSGEILECVDEEESS